MKHYVLKIDNRESLEQQFRAIPPDTTSLHIEDDFSNLRFRWMTNQFSKLLPVRLGGLSLEGQQLSADYPEFGNHFPNKTVVDQLLEFIAETPAGLVELDLTSTGLEHLPTGEFGKLCKWMAQKIAVIHMPQNNFSAHQSLQEVIDALSTLVYIESLNLSSCFPHGTRDYNAQRIANKLPKTLIFIKIDEHIASYLSTEAIGEMHGEELPWRKMISFEPVVQPSQYQEEEKEEDHQEDANDSNSQETYPELEIIDQLIRLMKYAQSETINPQHYNRFMHWLHHGDASQAEVTKAINALENAHNLIDAINIISHLFSRHNGGNPDSTSGLHTNSFDTIFLQLLFANGSRLSLPQKGLMFLDENEITSFKRYSLDAVLKGEFRFGRDAENLSGPNRLPEKNRAGYRSLAISTLQGMLPTLGYQLELKEESHFSPAHQ